MKSLSERRIAAEDRLGEIENEIEILVKRIETLKAEYASIEPVWKNLSELEDQERRRFDLFTEVGNATKPQYQNESL